MLDKAGDEEREIELGGCGEAVYENEAFVNPE